MKVVMKLLALSLGFLMITGSSLAVRFLDNTVRDSAISEGKKLPSLAQIKLSNGETAYGVVVSQKVNNPRRMTEVVILTGYPFTKDQADEIFSFTINGREYRIDFSEEALDKNGAKGGYFFRGISADSDKDVIVSQLGMYSKNPHDPAIAKDDFDSFEEYSTTAVYGKEVYIHGLVKSSDGSVSSAKAVGMGFYDNDPSSFQVSYRTTNFLLDKEDCYQPVYVLGNLRRYILVGFLGRDVHLNQPANRSVFVTLSRGHYLEMANVAQGSAAMKGFVVPKQEVMAFQKNKALFPRGALIGSRWILTSVERDIRLPSVRFPGNSSIAVKKVHQLNSNNKLYLIELASDISGIAPVKRLQLPNNADGIEAFLWKKHLITTKFEDPESYYTLGMTYLRAGATKTEAFELFSRNVAIEDLASVQASNILTLVADFTLDSYSPYLNYYRGWTIDSAVQGTFLNERHFSSDGNPSCIVDPDNANNFALIGIRTSSPLNTVDKNMATELESALNSVGSTSMPATARIQIEHLIDSLKKLPEDERTYGALLRESSLVKLRLLDLYDHFTKSNVQAPKPITETDSASTKSTITFMSDQVNGEIESITGIPAVDRLDSPYPAVSTSSSTSSTSTSSTTSTSSSTSSSTNTGSSSSTSSSSLSVHAFNSSQDQDIHFDPSFVIVPLSASSSDDFRMRFGSQEVAATSLKRSSTHHLAVLNKPILDDLTPLPRNIPLGERALIRNMMIAWSLGDQAYLNSLKSAVSTFGRTSGPSVRLSSNPDSPDQNGLYLLTPNFVFGQDPQTAAVLNFNGTDVDLGDAIYSNSLAGNLYFSAQPLFQNGPYSRVGSFHWIAAQLKNSIINAMIAESLKR